MPEPRILKYNKWAFDLYAPLAESPYDYMFAEGGRGSSKTYELTQALIYKAHFEPLRIAVAREHLKSIDESAKPELEERIKQFGLMGAHGYKTTKTSIDHANGTHIFFIGLSKLSEEDIKGLAMVDILWNEEAHRTSHASWRLLRPTIRKDTAQIWASWNNKYRNDAISKFLKDNKRDPRVWHRHVTYRNNKFFTARNDRDRLRDKAQNPKRYGHIWEGDFDDASEKRKVLPYGLLRLCIDAWPRRPVRGAFSTAGLDVADTGDDQNALCLRAGPELYFMQLWRGSDTFTTSDSARKAAKICNKYGVGRFMYDAGGVGAGIRGPIREGSPNFAVVGCQFGGAVQAEDVPYIAGRKPKTQKQYFANWASQAGWALRMRADMTQRLMNGEDVPLERCLFINPDLPDLEDVLNEMAQPEWDADGKLKINKQPRAPGEPKPDSPDSWDAAVLAYSTDARRGLRERGVPIM